MKLRRTMLDVRRLRLLVALEVLGTVRAVAAAHALSPSAVSQQLAALEAECGVELLVRHGRALRLTPAGHALAAQGVDLLDRIAGLEGEIGAWRDAEAGLVRVGGLASALGAFVIDAARAVRTAHPRLRVELQELEPDAIAGALVRGAIDVAVVADYGHPSAPPPDASVRRTPLADDELVVVLPPGDEHAGRDAVPLASLAARTWLVDGTDLERHVVVLCREAGFEPDVAGRLSSHEGLLQAVAGGLGVTVLPRLAVRGATGDVVLRGLAPARHRTLHALTRRAAEHQRPLRVVREAIVASARAATALT